MAKKYKLKTLEDLEQYMSNKGNKNPYSRGSKNRTVEDIRESRGLPRRDTSPSHPQFTGPTKPIGPQEQPQARYDSPIGPQYQEQEQPLPIGPQQPTYDRPAGPQEQRYRQPIGPNQPIYEQPLGPQQLPKYQSPIGPQDPRGPINLQDLKTSELQRQMDQQTQQDFERQQNLQGLSVYDRYIEQLKTQQPNPNTPMSNRIMAAGAGFVDTASLGLQNVPGGQQYMEQYPTSANIGKGLGYVVPGTGFSKGAGAVTRPLLNRIGGAGLKATGTATRGIGKQALRTGAKIGTQEAIAGAVMGGSEGAIRGEGLEGSAKRAAEYGLFGGVGGAILGGLGQLGSDLIQLSKVNKSKMLDDLLLHERGMKEGYIRAKNTNDINVYDDLIQQNEMAKTGLKSNKAFGVSNKKIERTLDDITMQLRKERAMLADGPQQPSPQQPSPQYQQLQKGTPQLNEPSTYRPNIYDPLPNVRDLTSHMPSTRQLPQMEMPLQPLADGPAINPTSRANTLKGLVDSITESTNKQTSKDYLTQGAKMLPAYKPENNTTYNSIIKQAQKKKAKKNNELDIPTEITPYNLEDSIDYIEMPRSKADKERLARANITTKEELQGALRSYVGNREQPKIYNPTKDVQTQKAKLPSFELDTPIGDLSTEVKPNVEKKPAEIKPPKKEGYFDKYLTEYHYKEIKEAGKIARRRASKRIANDQQYKNDPELRRKHLDKIQKETEFDKKEYFLKIVTDEQIAYSQIKDRKEIDKKLISEQDARNKLRTEGMNLGVRPATVFDIVNRDLDNLNQDLKNNKITPQDIHKVLDFADKNEYINEYDLKFLREQFPREVDTKPIKEVKSPTEDNLTSEKAKAKDIEQPLPKGQIKKPKEEVVKVEKPKEDLAESTSPKIVEGEFFFSKKDIDYENERRSYEGTSFDSDKRADSSISEYVRDMEEIKDKIYKLAETDEQKAIALEELNRYKAKYLEHKNKMTAARSRVLSPMITGPARFPTARNQKALERESKVVSEFLEWHKKAEKNMIKKVKGKENLKKELNDNWMAEIKASVKAYHNDIDKLVAQGYDKNLFKSSILGKMARAANNGEVEKVRELLQYIKDNAPKMFAKNNNIWRLEEVALAQATKETPSGSRLFREYEGAKIIQNYDEDRIQIYFDEQPPENVIKKLKGRGFRFSRRNDNAWQRKLTSNAERDSESVVSEFHSKKDKVLGFSGPSGQAQAYPKSKGTSKIEDAISPTQMVQKFADRFEDVYIRKGTTGRNAIGDFNTRTYVTRLKKSNDIPTLSHEMAHYLDTKNGIIEGMSKEEQQELASIFTDTQSDKMELDEKAMESFAEIVRSYLVGESVVGDYGKYVESNLNKTDLDFLAEMKKDITTFVNLDPISQVRKTVYADGDVLPKVKRSFTDVVERFYTDWVDEQRPVYKAAQELGGKAAKQEMKEHLAQLRGYKSTAEFAINPHGAKGKYQSNLQGENVGRSLYDIVEPISKAGKEVNDDFWRVYSVAMRAKDYKAKGFELPLPYSTYEKSLDMLEKKYPDLFPTFNEVFEELATYKNNLMQLLVDSGLKKQADIDKIIADNPNHVHFFRVMDAKDKSVISGGGDKIGSINNPIKAVKGSGRDIVDPYESIIKMTYVYWNVARKQQVMSELANLESKSTGKGKLISKSDVKYVPKKLSETDVSRVVSKYFNTLFANSDLTGKELEELRTDFKEARKRVEIVNPDLESIAQTLYEIDSRADKGQIVIFNNGDPSVYDISDELSHTLQNHNEVFNNALIRTLTKVGDFQAKTIMLNPKFLYNLAIREIGEDLLFTRTGMTPLDIMKAYFNVMGGNAIWREFEKQGGINTVYFAKDGEFEKQTIESMLASTSKAKKMKHRFKKWNDSVMDALVVLDVSPKLAEFTKELEKQGVIKQSLFASIREAYKNRTDKKISDEFIEMQSKLQGIDPKQYRAAIEKARDISYDPSKKGALMKKYQLNSIFRFSNPAIQGTANFFRKPLFYEESRNNLIKRGTSMAMFAVGLAIALRENKTYEDMEDWKKDTYWWIPIGDPATTTYFIAVAKPFQSALLFSTVPERVVRKMNKDPYVSKRAFDNFANSVQNTFMPSLTPIATSPLLENWFNEKWNGLPVESAIDKYRLPQDRYNDYTSTVATSIAKITNQIKYMPEMLKSPKQIDNLIKGYTNRPGRTALTAVDAIAGKRPAKDIVTSSGVLDLGVRDISQGSSKAISELYKDKGKLQQELNSLKFRVKEGKDIKLESIKRYVVGKEVLSLYNKATKELSEIRKLKKFSFKRGNQDASKKLQKKMVELARTVNTLTDRIESNIK